MQTNIKTQIKNELVAIEHYELSHRSAVARLGALVLICATLFHLSGVDHATMPHSRAELSARLAPKVSYAEKNETGRMPIKFDDGLRAVATTGI